MDHMTSLINQYKSLEAQRNLFFNELDRISRLLGEMKSTKTALESLKDQESFFGIGSGVMARAKPTSEKVIMPIGSNILLELPIDQASERLEKRIEAGEEGIKKLQQEIKKIEDKMLELQIHISSHQNKQQ